MSTPELGALASKVAQLEAKSSSTSFPTSTNFPTSLDSGTGFAAVEAIETALLDGAPLHIDDANERVGIGTTSPSTTLDVSGTATATSFSGPLTGNVTGDVSGNAGTATKLANARTISLTGDVTGSVSFDGSGNAAITATVADDSHNHTTAWTSFTPSWTNLSVGSGAVESWYYAQVGDVVFVEGRTILGTSASITGLIQVSVPVGTAQSLFDIPIGTVAYSGNGISGFIYGTCDQYAQKLRFFIYNASSTYVTKDVSSSTVPWSGPSYSGSHIRLSARYRIS